MTELLNYSKSILTNRRKRIGENIVGSGDYMFALGPEIGIPFTFSDDTFVVDGITYEDLIGWSVGDFHEVSTTVNEPITNAIRLKGKAKAPVIGSHKWEFSILVDGVKEITKIIPEDGLNLNDIALPLLSIASPFTLSFRLELI